MLLLPLICIIITNICHNKKNVRDVSLGLFFIATLYIIFFRYGMGTDYFSYKAIYNSMTATNFTNTVNSFNSIEYGYLLINLIFNKVGISYHTFSVIVSLFVFVSYVYWLKLYMDHRQLSIALLVYYAMFFIVWTLSAYRQSIVLSIALLTVFNPQKKLSFIKKTSMILVLTTIHYSALILFVYLLLERLINSKRRLYFLLSVSTIILLLSIFITSNHGGLMLPFSIKIFAKINSYLGKSGISLFAILIRLLFLSYLLLFYDDFKKEDHQIFYIYKVYIIGMAIYFSLSNWPLISSRITVYSYIFLPLLLAKTIDFIKDKSFSTIYIQKFENIVLTAFLFIMIAFFYKEISSFNIQSGYDKNLFLEPVPTIFSDSGFDFKSKYGTKDAVLNIENDIEKEFVNEVNFNGYAYQDGDYFTAAKDNKTGLFGVINQRGEFVTQVDMMYSPKVYGGLYTRHLQKSDSELFVFASVHSSFDEKKLENVEKYKNKETDILIQPVYQKTKFDDTDYGYKSVKIYLEKQGIKDYLILREMIHTRPLKYSIFEIEIQDNKYLCLLINDVVVSRMLYERYERYDVNGFIRFKTTTKTHIYNKEGELIWIEN